MDEYFLLCNCAQFTHGHAGKRKLLLYEGQNLCRECHWIFYGLGGAVEI